MSDVISNRLLTICEKLESIINKLDKTISSPEQENQIEKSTWKVYAEAKWYCTSIYAHVYGDIAKSDLEKMLNKTFHSEQEAKDCLKLFISTHWRSECTNLSISVDKDYSREQLLHLIK